MKSESFTPKSQGRQESITLFLTDRCDLFCQHCYVESGPRRFAAMTPETFRRCLDLFTAAGVRDARFTGGEPTLHAGFGDFTRHARERDCRVRLITNGLSLAGRPDLLDNVDECWVSLYALTPEEYRAITRSKRADLDRLLRTLSGLAERGHPTIGLSVLLQPSTMEAVGPFLDTLAAAGFRRVRFIPLQPDGRGTAMEIPDVLAWRRALIDLSHRLRGLTAEGRFETLGINDVFDFEEKYREPRDSCLLRERWMWSIRPNGDVYTCCFNVHAESHRIGNVWTSTYEELARALRPGPPACRGLETRFWGRDDIPVSCPLSRVTWEHHV